MDTCPYTSLPDEAWWKRSMTDPPPHAVTPLGMSDFQIEPGEWIATAGSCFAQHMGRRLPGLGMNYLVTEPGPTRLSAGERNKRQYGIFSARFGNIYTTTQLRQLFLRAYGDFTPEDDVWRSPEGRFFDLFRPSVEPGGFATLDELTWDRDRHFTAVRKLVAQANIFVFTMGLTEGWRHKGDGAVYPSCPGCGPGDYDADKYEFVNIGVSQTLDDLDAIFGLLNKNGNAIRLILTVSPVPLIATMSGHHVLAATTYSKSVLRVAAQDFAAGQGNCSYFPSYEIITGPHARGSYFQHDLRTVSLHGVDHVMRCFTETFLRSSQFATPPAAHRERPEQPETETVADKSDGIDIICDEETLAERYGQTRDAS